MRFSRVLMVVTVVVLAVFTLIESLFGGGGLTVEEAIEISRNSPFVQKYLKNYEHYWIEVHHGNASGLLLLLYNDHEEGPYFVQFHAMNASEPRRSYGTWDISWYMSRGVGGLVVSQGIDGENGEILSEDLASVR